MHNVRTKWVRLTAPHLEVPTQLNRAHCTPQQARAGLAESAVRCAEMLAEALGGSGGRVESFVDGWAALAGWPGDVVLHAFSRSPPSRSGVYARASARIAVANKVTSEIWNWERLWKECGSSGGPVTIKELRKGTDRPEMGCDGGDIEPSPWGCSRTPGGRIVVGVYFPYRLTA